MAIIKNQSWAEYRAMPMMNPSMLKHGLRSMKRLKRAMAGECNPDPKNVIVGNAVHCLIAGEYDDRFAAIPAFEKSPENVTGTGKASMSKATAYYKEATKQWRDESLGDREAINEGQQGAAEKTAYEIRKWAGGLIDRSDQEVAVTGEIEGLPMKTRIDGIDGTHIWDLKTTADVADDAFYRTFKRFRYAFSFAVHVELLRQNGFFVSKYSVLAAEISDDYDVRKIAVPMLLIESTMHAVRRVAKQCRKAMDTEIWPGIGDGELPVPNWDMNTNDDLELEWGEE